jgi:hypothetical protein
MPEAPMETAGTLLFIEKMIEKYQDFENYELIHDHFLFVSIYNILKDDPERFWKEP